MTRHDLKVNGILIIATLAMITFIVMAGT